MKKLYTLLLFTVFTTITFSQTTLIPDSAFEQKLIALGIDTNGENGNILNSDAIIVTDTLNIISSNINNLAGIEAFTNITGLSCGYNNLTTINLSQNTLLNFLFINGNQLTALNTDSNIALKNLQCSNNPNLSNLDLTQNTLLKLLACENIGLSTLSLTQNSGITSLSCGTNSLTSLNISNLTGLTRLECENNLIENLDVSQNVLLDKIYCWNNKISTLDFSACLDLSNLRCQDNLLTSLISGNSKPTWIWCYDNDLSSLDFENNSFLGELKCYSNNLTSLSVNGALDNLHCNDNQFTFLDLSHVVDLKKLECQNNNLSSLNLKNGFNFNMSSFNSTGNPNLSLICVDDLAIANGLLSNKDPWTSFTTDCSTLSTEDFALQNIKIYPNPASNIINITSTQNIDVVEVYDVLGKQVLKANTNRIDVSTLQSGIYLLRIHSENTVFTKKIIKE